MAHRHMKYMVHDARMIASHVCVHVKAAYKIKSGQN